MGKNQLRHDGRRGNRDSVKEEYRNYLIESDFSWCFWCGRGILHRPASWHTPWLIERSHIVSNPRAEDRRAVILLCTMCHMVQHGHQLVLPGCTVIKPDINNMLWLKRRFDPAYYDRAFLKRHIIGCLPFSRTPPKEVLAAYRERRGEYPNL